MRRNNQICSDCQSDKLVWDWANGDVVCTSCGLVNEERFVDDRFCYQNYQDHEQETKMIDKHVGKVVSTINTVLYNGMIDDTSVMTDRIQHIYDKNDKKPSTVDVVANVYSCGKGMIAHELCTQLNIKPKTFWKSVKGDVVWEERVIDLVKRLVYENARFDKKEEWPIIKCSMKIVERIKDSSEIQNIKTDKLAITIIYIACLCQKKLYDKKEFVKLYRISIETLKRHESIIQAILKKSKS